MNTMPSCPLTRLWRWEEDVQPGVLAGCLSGGLWWPPFFRASITLQGLITSPRLRSQRLSQIASWWPETSHMQVIAFAEMWSKVLWEINPLSKWLTLSAHYCTSIHGPEQANLGPQKTLLMTPDTIIHSLKKCKDHLTYYWEILYLSVYPFVTDWSFSSHGLWIVINFHTIILSCLWCWLTSSSK